MDSAVTHAWPAPAKLNLFLHITGRRPDGYHLLQTVFQFIGLADELRFELRDDGRIARGRSNLDVAEPNDLTLRAARALKEHTGTHKGATIHVGKRIPLGGGLGGGSSDAATTLVALNHLWGTGVDASELATLGLALGADVPVFVHGHAAWAEGVGEQLTPVEPATPWYVVVHPACHVATGEIFNAPELTRHCPALKIRDFFAGQGTNVCEPVVRRHYPGVAAALDWLARFAPARMTGTGACIFAAFDSEQAARVVAAQLPVPWHGFVAQGMNTSPLQARLSSARSEKIG